jgi:predicted transcriptional regulator
MTDLLNVSTLLEHTSRIAAAYVASQKTPIEDISQVVSRIFQSLSEISLNPTGTASRAPSAPAVPIEDSVHDEYIVCLEDGKQLQMLKRHLSTVYGLTLQQYKDRWDLPHDYPVVSPSYARRRSAIAKNTGLGKTGRKKSKLSMLKTA